MQTLPESDLSGVLVSFFIYFITENNSIKL